MGVFGVDRAIAAAAALGAAAHVLPAATWIPAVRRLSPPLEGRGHAGHVALTFDDGPHPDSTPSLLDLLAAQGISATFFVLGTRAARWPDLVRDIAGRGHEVAVHGWSHDYLLSHGPRAALADLRRTSELVHELTGRRPQWFRPAYGVLTGPALWAARRAALRPVLWSTWGRDWEATDAPRIAARVLAGLTPGGTVLLHESPVGGDPGANPRIRAAVPLVLTACRDRGLRVGPLAEHGIGGR